MKKLFKALAISAASVAMVAGIATATACSGGYNGTYTGGYSYTNSYGQTYGMMVEVTVENNIITKVKDVTNVDTSKQSGIAKDWGTGAYAFKESGVEWHDVSNGWTKYFGLSVKDNYSWLLFSYTKDKDTQEYPEAFDNATVVNKKGESAGSLTDGKQYYKYKDEKGKVDDHKFVEWDGKVVPDEDQANGNYGWSDDQEKTWSTQKAWLLQQYEGWSVADVLDIKVFYANGYSVDANDPTKLVEDSNVAGEPYGTKPTNLNENLASSGLLVSGSTQGSGRLILAVQNALLGK